MREMSRRMALCGVLSALAMVALMLGGLLPLATFCAPILAMVALLPILPEFGPRWAWAAYGATALLALLLVPDREMGLVYVFFGGYPLLRPYLERIPTRPLRLAGKLLVCNAAMAALYAVVLFVFQLEAVTAEFSTLSAGFLGLLLLLANANFLVLDLVIGRLTALWNHKLRRKLLRN
ncbi:MAG: hypothetical protein RR035_07365 [Oscillibacter sp.]